jgi:hypothetical protein
MMASMKLGLVTALPEEMAGQYTTGILAGCSPDA